jgi:Uma2 family endonuclease
MATTLLTRVDEIAALPSDQFRYDLIQGELYRMSPASARHGEIAMEIAWHIKTFVTEHQLGTVYAAETGFLLGRDPDTLLAPDVAFVRGDRLPEPARQQGFLALAPDLVVEVVSPSDTSRYVSDKVLTYLDAGCQLVWVVEPERRTVTVWTPDRAARVIMAQERLEGGNVLPGFGLNLADIFPASR